MRNHLRISLWVLPTLLGAVSPMAHAGCGDVSQIQAPFTLVASDAGAKAQALIQRAEAASASIRANSGGVVNTATIVGLWSFQFISQGNESHAPAIPDGALLDFGYSEWHSDGTEILNSGGRAPATGNFCLGVFVRSGFFTYELNHVGLGYDGSTGQLNGKSLIHESVTLDPSGNEYSGTLSIDVFDAAGDVQVDHLTGTVLAKRVTVDQTTP